MEFTRIERMAESSYRASLPLTERVGQVYVSHREKIYRFLAAQGVPPMVAQEMTQEVFLKLLVRLRDGYEVTSEQAWLYRAAANGAVDYWRRERRLMSVELDAASPLAKTLESPEMRADEQAENEQRMNRLGAEIRRLPKEHRMCVLLRSQGLRYREIARILGVGVSTAADWLNAAVDRLRRAADE